nr:MAG TPA: tail collar domain [Caudoviricetes sp.]
MATNNILSFCAGANPNVLTPTAWQTTPARSSGFVSGIARSSHVNTAVVGGANIAHAVGEFIKNQLNEDVNPTDETTLVSQFLRALQVFIQKGGACPVGSIIPYLGGDVPYGWLLANGASVLRSQYDKLFALIGTKFGSADEAHFNLPNLHHRFIEGTTTLSEVGSYVEAGLPNSAGKLTGVATGADQEGLGALSWSDEFLSRNFETGTPPAAKYRNISLNLHNGTAIFGASSTVQPASLRVYFLIRYA